MLDYYNGQHDEIHAHYVITKLTAFKFKRLRKVMIFVFFSILGARFQKPSCRCNRGEQPLIVTMQNIVYSKQTVRKP